MTIELIYNTPLWVCSTAIRKCWASEDKSDTPKHLTGVPLPVKGRPSDIRCNVCGHHFCICETLSTGEKDKALIERVGNKNKHSSTLEHLVYTFDIDGISRACLQELARHRHTSLSVKSTRYTLKELKNTHLPTIREAYNFIVETGDFNIDFFNYSQLEDIQDKLKQGVSNDIVKYMLPEAYKTSLVWTINARSLQNFLALRTSKSALAEIRELAYEIYDKLPTEHQYLFTDSLYMNGVVRDD